MRESDFGLGRRGGGRGRGGRATFVGDDRLENQHRNGAVSAADAGGPALSIGRLQRGKRDASARREGRRHRAAARLCAEEITRRKADYYRTKPRKRGVKPQWKHRATKRLWPGDKRFAASFHLGFRAAIAARYDAQRAAAEVSDQALILRRSDAEAAEFAAEFTRTANALKKVKVHDSAVFAGWREGQKVDLGLKGVKTSKPAGLLGE